MRKAQYSLIRNLRGEFESPATLFGSAVHAALEVWYCAPKSNRKASTNYCDDAQADMLNLNVPQAHGECARCASVFMFIEKSTELRMLPDSDKRSVSNGIGILNNYFDHYLDDPFSVYVDKDGPVIERSCSKRLYNSESLSIDFFGTIDTVFHNVDTGSLIVVDHKTTSSLGSDFYNRIKPNFQYIGYTWMAKEVLGIDTDMFMANGIQVAKTKFGLSRQVVKITDDDKDELKEAIVFNVKKFLECVDDDSFPMSAPNPCTMWGGCQYRSICETPRSLRETVISGLYKGETRMYVED